MGVGKSANQALAEQGADYSPDADAVFIANIHVHAGGSAARGVGSVIL